MRRWWRRWWRRLCRLVSRGLLSGAQPDSEQNLDAGASLTRGVCRHPRLHPLALCMRRRAIAYALLSAILFGASTPLAKLLVGSVAPLALAGVLYLGSGIGLAGWLAMRKARTSPNLSARDLPWLAGAIAAGGIVGPALLMYGLARTDAASASLLLNLEAVFTAAMAWIVFREN